MHTVEEGCCVVLRPYNADTSLIQLLCVCIRVKYSTYTINSMYDVYDHIYVVVQYVRMCASCNLS
jgi:hypothetical protein